MIVKRFLMFALVGIVLSFSLLAYFLLSHGASSLEKTAEEGYRLCADSLSTSLKRSMVEGVPNIARDIVSELNEQGMIKAAVFKADGSFAFGERLEHENE